MSRRSRRRLNRKRAPITTSQAATKARQLVNQGARLIEQGRPSQAISLLAEAARLDPGNTSALINLGSAYIMSGRHGDAILLLEAVRDVDPLNPMIWINLGAAYLGNPVLAKPDQQLQAANAFRRALELDPAAPSVHYNIGLIHIDRGEIEPARAAFRRAIETNPGDRDAAVWLRRLEAGLQAPSLPAQPCPGICGFEADTVRSEAVPPAISPYRERGADSVSVMHKPWWKCAECGYLFQAPQPPEACPSCNARCVFVDATCYTPECGGPESGNPDPKVVAR